MLATTVRPAAAEDVSMLGIIGPTACAEAYSYLWDRANAYSEQLQSLVNRPSRRCLPGPTLVKVPAASPTHTRVLGPETWPAWLGDDPADARRLKTLLAPYPSEEMMRWPASSRVGNVKNNDSSLIEPTSVQ